MSRLTSDTLGTHHLHRSSFIVQLVAVPLDRFLVAKSFIYLSIAVPVHDTDRLNAAFVPGIVCELVAHENGWLWYELCRRLSGGFSVGGFSVVLLYRTRSSHA